MSDVEELWQKSLKRIEQVVSKPSFEGWIKALHPLELKGDELILAAPNKFTADHVKRRFIRIIGNIIGEILGKTVKIEIIVDEEEERSKEEKDVKGVDEGLNIDYQYYGLNPKYVFETFVVGKC
ncbi:MAG: chromosomal replication initiator protein DnaA, partial [Synergistetes bacterium]|nr:chromosomal replication initiator protein DnaA [Synergistota bacterium]